MIENLHLPHRLAVGRVADDDQATLFSVAEGIDEAVGGWLARLASDRLIVTLASADFAAGLLVMIRSLRAVSDVPVLVLKLGSWRFEHEASGVAAIEVPALFRPGMDTRPDLPHLAVTLSKLWAFSITTPKRIAHVDADCLILRPIDGLLDGDGFAAAPDLLLHYRLRAFNAGVFSFTPSPALRERLFRRLQELPVSDGDQSILNGFFEEWRQLPLGLNFLRSQALVRALAQDANLRILHYTPVKPWTSGPADPRDHALAPLDDLWMDRLSDAEYREVKRRWQQDVDAVERNLTAWASRSAGVYRDQIAEGLTRTRRRLRLWLAGLVVLAAAQTLLLCWLILRG
jgi:glycogenin